ncbi:TPA: GNAT family N-acetyltransferase [Citrobacter braakii]|uniref:GNAT family N-acetyltransferase n=1 Tax=Raoultella lignicola TaxID=3040939 RepID=A0ABU9F6Y5_9ENTR|nr:GNAT family N-acetyltransferase [Citrobacter braakii]
MGIQFRLAQSSDVEAIFDVRTSVTENHLSRKEMQQMGITEATIAAMIAQGPCAWVAVDNGKIVEFSMILTDECCLFSAFVVPAYENKGIGRGLVSAAETEMFKHHQIAWLETAKNSRAVQFYRHLGWGNETDIDDADVRLEKRKII